MAKFVIDQFRKDAGSLEPFELDDGQGGEIVIHPPDSEAVLDINDYRDQPRVILQKLCGDEYERVWELVRHEPPGVLNAMVEAMVKTFYPNAQDVPGGTRALSS
jgi:hypothetical protein